MERYTKYPHIFKTDKIRALRRLHRKNMIMESEELGYRRKPLKNTLGSITGETGRKKMLTTTNSSFAVPAARAASHRDHFHHGKHLYNSVDISKANATQYLGGKAPADESGILNVTNK